MSHEKSRANTSLATYFWEQKDRGITPTIEWKVIRKCRKYMCGGKRCDVCLSEKLAILKNSDPNLINKKSELMGKCPQSSQEEAETLPCRDHLVNYNFRDRGGCNKSCAGSVINLNMRR